MSKRSHSTLNFQIKKIIKNDNNKDGQTLISSSVDKDSQIKKIKKDNESITQTPVFSNINKNKTISTGRKIRNNKYDNHLLSNFNNKSQTSTIKKNYNGRITPNSKTYIQKHLHIPQKKDSSSSNNSNINNKNNKYKNDSNRNEDENDLIEEYDLNETEKVLSTPILHDSIENINFDETSTISNNKNSSNKVLIQKRQKRKFSDINENEELTPRKRNFYSKSQTTTPKRKSITNYTDSMSENVNSNSKKPTQIHFSKELKDYNIVTSKKVFKFINKHEIQSVPKKNSDITEQYQNISDKLALYQQNINNRINNININQKQKNDSNNNKIKEINNTEKVNERVKDKIVKEEKINENVGKIKKLNNNKGNEDKKLKDEHNNKGNEEFIYEKLKEEHYMEKIKQIDNDNKPQINVDFNIFDDCEIENKTDNDSLKRDNTILVNIMEVDDNLKTNNIVENNNILKIKNKGELNDYDDFPFEYNFNQKFSDLKESSNNLNNNPHNIPQHENNNNNNENKNNSKFENKTKISIDNNKIESSPEIASSGDDNCFDINLENYKNGENNAKDSTKSNNKDEILFKKELTEDIFKQSDDSFVNSLSDNNYEKPIHNEQEKEIKPVDIDNSYDILDELLMSSTEFSFEDIAKAYQETSNNSNNINNNINNTNNNDNINNNVNITNNNNINNINNQIVN